ncbi:CcdB family protein [Aliarcobacter butzleri]|uniref:CcdB family protein n=1 Tax=Aliarcobacter butzleri TaxID=28197 RepID=UPI001EDA2C43|nr:CcdB family protein [Aliarcobacter butzleri]MCG3679002.1 CcdB family protein [Aliarcobacter butzleri]
MAQFDVYENLNEKSKQNIPYLLDIQNDILKDLTTRVVIPLLITNKAINFLNPKFTINQIDVILSTAEMASIPMEILGEKICSLKEKRLLVQLIFWLRGFNKN